MVASHNGGLVKVHGAVGGLRRAVAPVGHLGVPHLALALSQLSHVSLEAQAELRVLAPGRFQPPFLQVDPLHVHHLLRCLRHIGGRFRPPCEEENAENGCYETTLICIPGFRCCSELSLVALQLQVTEIFHNLYRAST